MSKASHRRGWSYRLESIVDDFLDRIQTLAPHPEPTPRPTHNPPGHKAQPVIP